MQYLYIIRADTSVLKITEFKINPDKCVVIKDGESTPLEDYDYLLSTENYTEEQAFDTWLEKTSNQ
jgi:hypothetical protein